MQEAGILECAYVVSEQVVESQELGIRCGPELRERKHETPDEGIDESYCERQYGWAHEKPRPVLHRLADEATVHNHVSVGLLLNSFLHICLRLSSGSPRNPRFTDPGSLKNRGGLASPDRSVIRRRFQARRQNPSGISCWQPCTALPSPGRRQSRPSSSWRRSVLHRTGSLLRRVRLSMNRRSVCS